MKPIIYHISSSTKETQFIKSICEEIKDAEVLTFNDVDDLVKNVLIRKPKLILIHLEIDGDLKNGYSLIKELRESIGFEESIIVMCPKSETHVISYSLYNGANDYIVLPASEHFLLDRIKREVSKQVKVFENFKKLNPPLKGKIFFALNPVKVDEEYLYFESPVYIVKNSEITIEHPLLYDIFKTSRMHFNVFDSTSLENGQDQLIKVGLKNPDGDYYQSLRAFLLKWNR